MNVTLIGTGIMGLGIAANLLKAGFSLRLYNRTKNRLKALEGQAELFDSPSAACHGSDIVILCLTTDNVVEEMFFHQGILDSSSGLILDFGTTSPDLTEKMHRAAKGKGISFADAPMTGSRDAAAAGQILFMTGASDEDFSKAKPVFDACGKNVVRCGKPGDGQKAKISLNLMLAGLVQVYSEGLILASKLGIEKSVMSSIISQSAAKSGVSEFKLPYMFSGNYETHFSLANMNKDLNHAITLALGHNAVLPVTSALKGIFDIAINDGLSGEDFCSVLKISERINNTKI